MLFAYDLIFIIVISIVQLLTLLILKGSHKRYAKLIALVALAVV